jgi:tetraacyldisaccharide 4'-kinase
MPRLIENLWYGDAPGWARLVEPPLALASCVYGIGLDIDQWRKFRRQKRLPRPVVSVGNITVGGTGKTPVTLWIANHLASLGQVPCILLRGYGASGQNPRKVDPETGDWTLYGDEPILLARGLVQGAVYVGHNRWAAGQLALSSEPKIDVFLLDDGFQHIELARDLDIVLVDGQKGFGNGHLLPWGPLREPVRALARAQAIGLVERPGGATAEEGPMPNLEEAAFQIELAPVGWRFAGEREVRPLESLPGDRPVRLVSGIGSPESFVGTVEACGLSVIGHSAYTDHHPFSQVEIEGERGVARMADARLVTTAKDVIRMETRLTSWTPEETPIIIELGLAHGDGPDYLTKVLKEALELFGQG